MVVSIPVIEFNWGRQMQNNEVWATAEDIVVLTEQTEHMVLAAETLLTGCAIADPQLCRAVTATVLAQASDLAARIKREADSLAARATG